ncbi:hypothetical protein ACF06X_23930 [Streptomyces sp. NPDC015346]|uniref:hypothetical protein n=1 Tax=Streptomyces sp. NPDC015346 TaxID=3364954 RepID=UPI0036F53EA9
MRTFVAQLCARARSLLTPTGRHRVGPIGPEPPQPQARLRPAPTVRAWYAPIDGATTALVRPYLHAYEREEAVRLQRRVTLLAAVYGFDLDTRVIHPLETT